MGPGIKTEPVPSFTRGENPTPHLLRRRQIAYACEPMRRALRVSLLVFQALWLNVLLPGHTRGIITTPGDASAPATRTVAGDCCHPDTAPAKDTPDQPAKRAAH